MLNPAGLTAFVPAGDGFCAPGATLEDRILLSGLCPAVGLGAGGFATELCPRFGEELTAEPLVVLPSAPLGDGTRLVATFATAAPSDVATASGTCPTGIDAVVSSRGGPEARFVRSFGVEPSVSGVTGSAPRDVGAEVGAISRPIFVSGCIGTPRTADGCADGSAKEAATPGAVGARAMSTVEGNAWSW